MLTFGPPGCIRVGILCSSRAPGLAGLLTHPQRGTAWNVACVVSSESVFQERDLLRNAGVPFFARPVRDFLAARNATLSDRAARSQYDGETGQLLRGMDVDVVVLLGYLLVLTPSFLDVFGGRVINVHDSDLTDLDARGEPRFVGLRSTRDAITAGAAETRSSVHVVTEKLDAGPVIAVSEAYPVAEFAREAARAGHRDIVRAYAWAQREWMMRDSWGAMVGDALDAFARRGGAFLTIVPGEKAAPRVPHTKAALARRESIAASA